MGIFDKLKNFQAGRQERRIEKNTKLVKNAKAIKEDRQAALSYLASVDDPDIAVPALLERFEYSLEHGIVDAREKETAMEGITRHGDAAIAQLKAHLKKTTRIAWPIKTLNKLADETSVVEVLQSALDFGDVSLDHALVDKNYDVLSYLADYKVPGLAQKLAHFLDDADERVRFACVEVLVNQEDDGIQQMIEKFLIDDSAENRRIRATVIEAFIAKGWRVDDPKAFPDGPLVEGVFVTKKGKVERRS